MKKLSLVFLLLFTLSCFNFHVTKTEIIKDYKYYIKDVYYITSTNQYVFDSYFIVGKWEKGRLIPFPIYTDKNTPKEYTDLIKSKRYNIYMRVVYNKITGKRKRYKTIIKPALFKKKCIIVEYIYQLPDNLNE